MAGGNGPIRGREFEQRLDELRDRARRQGSVEAEGIRARGGPMPEHRPPAAATHAGPGYYGLPVLKPPVWEWMIPAYFFIGGWAGMSALLAAVALFAADAELVRAMAWTAAAGGVAAPILLIWDLGRPARFLHMLRVFKPQSPMSVGSWIVAAFGAAAVPGALLFEWDLARTAAGEASVVIHGLAVAAIVSAAAFGILLGTYTGALLAVTAVPAWHRHRALLPFHFGVAALGSAAGFALLLAGDQPPLVALLALAAAAEIIVALLLELRRHGDVDRALHEGRPAWMMRGGELLAGPLALVLLLVSPAAGALSFLAGALLARFAWLAAGRASALDPKATFAEQGG